MKITNVWFDYDKYYFKTENNNKWRQRRIKMLIFVRKKDWKKVLPILKNNFSKVKKINNHLRLIKGFRDIFDHELVGVEFLNQNDLIKYLDFIKFLDRKKIPHYGVNLFKYKILLDEDIEFDFKNRRIWFFDIEVDNFTDGKRQGDINDDIQLQEREIISITFYDTVDKKYYQFVVDPNHEEEKYEKVDEGKYIVIFKTEKDMLKTFIKTLRTKQPNILTGWYSEGYDIPYMINRLNRLFGEVEHFTLIKGVKPKSKQVLKHDKTVYYNTIGGIETIDYMDIYKKFSMKNPPSWGLDKVQEFEGIEGKTESKGFLNYKINFQRFLDYIFRDVEILVWLEEKNKLLKMMLSLQELLKTPLDNILMNSKTVEQMIYHTMIKDKKILNSSKVDSQGSSTYQGQIVLEPKNQTYDDVMVFDFQSLYPNSIITFNISPETMVVGEENIKLLDERKIPYVDFNEIFKSVGIRSIKDRIVYRLDKEGILPKTVKILINERLRYKKIYKEQPEGSEEKNEYNLKQWNYKIIINSLYGYLGYKYSPLFNINLQVSVSGSQRYIFLSQKDILEKYDKYKIDVIYGDTDSEFIKIYDKNGNEIKIKDDEHLEQLQKEISEHINEKMNEYITKICRNITLDQVRSFNTERIELDKFFKRVRFFGVKKRYYGYDQHGNELYHGIELIRSDTPNSIKHILSNLFKKQLNHQISKQDLLDIYETIKKFDLIDIGTPKSVTQLNFDNYKVIPQHVRGILFQKFLDVPLGDVITDKIFIIPVIVKNTNKEIFNKQREIFNFKRKNTKEEKVVISVTPDLVDEFKKLLETKYKDVIEVDYLTFFEKNILDKLKQFSELINMIEDVKNYLRQKDMLNNKLSLFNMIS